MRETATLATKSLTAGYGEVVVVRDVQLSVPHGAVSVLLGPNGAGKTTVLRCISGLVTPKQGTVWLDGTDIGGLDPAARVRAGITFIPEGRAIFPGLSVRDNFRVFGRLASGRGTSTEADAVERAVTHFPRLRDRLRQRAGTLSGGEQQMLALSRVFFGDAKLVIIDEMSLGLAPRIVSELFEFVAELRAATDAAILLTDQFVHQALGVADVVYVMQNGTVRFVADPSEPGLEDAIHRIYVGAAGDTLAASSVPSAASTQRSAHL
ncbi:MAG: ABC transporter ATP-binding protein [Actinomycetota bacterium]